MSEQITTPEALDALPDGAIIRLAGASGAPAVKFAGDWIVAGLEDAVDATVVMSGMGATVLFRPDAPTPTPAEGDGDGDGDEYHTLDELYEYRMLYNAHAAIGWRAAGIPVVKSRRHSDGEPCFGGGWFIVVATLPDGQASNHYRDEHWALFAVPEVDLPPEYDGHTPQVAARRLRAALTLPPTPAGDDQRERAAAAEARRLYDWHIQADADLIVALRSAFRAGVEFALVEVHP